VFLLRTIYCFVLEYDTKQTVSACEISNPTLIKIKKDMKVNIKYNCRNEKIRGSGVEVQIDETAICNGKIVTCPSNTLDNTSGVQWIVCGVERQNGRNLFLVLVPNRKHETMLGVFKIFIMPGSFLVTVGYPSYISSVREFGSSHIVVNHSLGFKNEAGYTTNKIENVWSHFKTMYRSRTGFATIEFRISLKNFYFEKKFSS
jgi:hypothetical protein